MMAGGDGLSVGTLFLGGHCCGKSIGVDNSSHFLSVIFLSLCMLDQ